MTKTKIFPLAVATVTLMGSGAAMADVAEMQFGYAKTGPEDRVVTVCDTAADGHSVYSEFDRSNGTGNRVEVFSGNGTCKASQWAEARVIRFNVCRNISYQPDTCSGTVNVQ